MSGHPKSQWNAPKTTGLLHGFIAYNSQCKLWLTHARKKFKCTSSRTLLTHWGRMTHICVSKLNIIGSDNGLSPVRRQAIIWTNAGMLLIRPLGTTFSEILIETHTFSFKEMHLKRWSAKWWPFCLGLNVLTHWTCGSKNKIFKLIAQHSILSTCCEIALWKMPQNITNEKSTSVQVMAWCCQAEAIT